MARSAADPLADQLTDAGRLRLWGNDRQRVVVAHARTEGSQEIAGLLAAAAFDVSAVPVDREMIRTLLAVRPDVVLVAHDETDFDIVRLCRDLRESFDSAIIVVWGAAEPDERIVVDTLDAGADNVVAHDTSAPVLLAHIRVSLRSRPVGERQAERLTIGDVTIDLGAHELTVGNDPVNCPPRQFLLLLALARQANAVISTDALLRRVWGAEPGSLDRRRLRVAVSQLRRILGVGARRPRIDTVSRIGYRLVGETGGDRPFPDERP